MAEYSRGHRKPYNDFSSHFKTIFIERVQKISVDAGFTCPNRDGTKSVGGCTYCNNNAFNPFYCDPEKSITQQLQEGINFFSDKYKTQQYIAYFQAYSNTYAKFKTLKKLYEEALSVPDVIGLVIATRPDCVDEEILDYLELLAEEYYISIEYGIESCNDNTLRKINRAHTFEDTVEALELSADRRINIGAHLVLGLPGESRGIMLKHADILSELPINTLKLHQLQIIKGTKMAKEYIENPRNFNLFTVNDYIEFIVDFLERLNPDIIIERFISESPKDLLIAPKWGGLKNYEISDRIVKKFYERGSRQGITYKGI